jgi:hypothetical protein
MSTTVMLPGFAAFIAATICGTIGRMSRYLP